MENGCTHCGSKNFVKNGSSGEVQRYKCKDCNRYFSNKAKKYSPDFKGKIVKVYLSGGGLRAISRAFGMSFKAVANWVKALRQEMDDQIQEARKALKKDKSPDIIEMDEIYTYCKKKANGCLFGLLILDGKSVLLDLHLEKDCKPL